MRPYDLYLKATNQMPKEGCCVSCKGPATEFKNELSRREYRLSCLCQACQDKVFTPPKEEEEEC